MKIYLSHFIAILIILAISPACEKIEPENTEPPKVILRKKSAEIIKADQRFAFELFKEVYSISEEENIMISPLSVSYALGMTYNGAGGTTIEAFRNVLHFGELTGQEINESYQDLMNQLIHLDELVEFSIANSIWYRLGFEVLQDFITTNQTYFDAVVNELDFSDPQAVDIINQWIEDKTNGKIQDMLDYIPAEAVMYLVNAIYFNAKWKYQFDQDDTYTGTFYMESDINCQADFMKINGTFNIITHSDFTAVEMPYGDSTFSMVVMLPASGKKVGDLVNELDETTWESWYGSSMPGNIQIELPKFKYGFKELLNEPLINLGLGIAFEEGGADFTRINPDDRLFISRVIHQTFIDVQEEGTEAAAATIVEMEYTAIPEINIFRADKPFLYLIKENSTGAVMFMGSVGKPEYE
jgi:serine protease inhibitor